MLDFTLLQEKFFSQIKELKISMTSALREKSVALW